MDIKEKSLIRHQSILLSQEEFKEAICGYLKNKGIKDTEQYVLLDVINTKSELGTQLKVTIYNYNNENNLIKSIQDGY